MITLAIATAPRRNSLHWEPGTVTWPEIISWVEHPADIKECGGYILGTLRETVVDHPGGKQGCRAVHRSKAAIVSRSALTLDVDKALDSLDTMVDKVTEIFGSAALLHTTFSSTPDEPRYRIIMPLNRPVTPEEYRVLVGMAMDKLGRAQFDEGSLEPERFMYLPATKKEAWFGSHGN